MHIVVDNYPEELSVKTADYNLILHTVSTHNVLPLTSACNFDCIFCSHKYNPPGLKVFTLPYLAKDRYNEMIDFLDPHQRVVVGESSTRIIEGEPFCRKDALDILEMIRERHPDTPITLTTNGSLIGRNEIDRLALLMPLEVNLSVNFLSDRARRMFLDDTGGSSMYRTIELLGEYGIPYNGSIVALGVDGWERELEKAVSYLESHGARTLRVFHPGYTRFCRDDRCKMDYLYLSGTVEKIAAQVALPVLLEPPNITGSEPLVGGVISGTPAQAAGFKKGDLIVRVDEAEAVSRVDAFKKILRAENPLVDIVRNGDEHRLRLNKGKGQSSGLVFNYDIDPEQMDAVLRAVSRSKACRPAVVTGEMAYPRIKKYLEGSCSAVAVIKSSNRFFGGNIGCAGLMVVDDIINSLEASPVKADLILVPSVAFDHRGDDLTGRNCREIEEAAGAKVQVI